MCVGSLSCQSVPVRINIWDNGSDVDVKNWIVGEVDRGVVNGLFIDHNTNAGTAGARNGGMSLIKSNTIMLSDDDMVYDEDFAKHMSALWEKIRVIDKRVVVLSNYHPFKKVYYRKKIFKSATSVGIYGVHYVTGTPPGNWIVDKDSIKELGGFYLPVGKKMGYSAFKLLRNINSSGFKVARLSNVNKKAYNGAIHADSVDYRNNKISLYEQTGYNAFRRKYK